MELSTATTQSLGIDRLSNILDILGRSLLYYSDAVAPNIDSSNGSSQNDRTRKGRGDHAFPVQGLSKKQSSCPSFSDSSSHTLYLALYSNRVSPFL